MLYYLDRKDLLKESKSISEQTGISMSRVHNLLKEQSDLEYLVESSSEINAERMMSVACSGYNPYDIYRVQSNKEEKRLREISSILYPKPDSLTSFTQLKEILNEELPF